MFNVMCIAEPGGTGMKPVAINEKKVPVCLFLLLNYIYILIKEEISRHKIRQICEKRNDFTCHSSFSFY